MLRPQGDIQVAKILTVQKRTALVRSQTEIHIVRSGFQCSAQTVSDFTALCAVKRLAFGIDVDFPADAAAVGTAIGDTMKCAEKARRNHFHERKRLLTSLSIE